MARKSRATPINPDTLMERTRAAVAYCNTSNDEGTDMAAFMALFHPEVEDDTVRQMVQDVRRKR